MNPSFTRHFLRAATLATAMAAATGNVAWADDPAPATKDETKSTATSDDVFDQHLLKSTGVVKVSDGIPCPLTCPPAGPPCMTPQPCPPMPGAPAVPSAPGLQPVPPAPGVPTTPGAPPAPPATPDGAPSPYNAPTPSTNLPQPEAPSAMASAFGNEAGSSFGENVPSIIGDFFSGHGNKIVTLEEPAQAVGITFAIHAANLGTSPTNTTPTNANGQVQFTYPGVGAPGFFSPTGVNIPTVNLTSVSTATDINTAGWNNTVATAKTSSFPFEFINGNQVVATYNDTNPTDKANYSKFLQNLDLNATALVREIPQFQNATGFFVITGQFSGSALTGSPNPGAYLPQAAVGLYTTTTPGGHITDPNNTFEFISQANFIPLIKVALPSGATSGEDKFADNTSPIPRDRVIFDYSYFDAVPLTPNGIDVNRFVAGFEKTLFRDDVSLEVRIPFATTLSENISIGPNGGLAQTNTDAVEFGNLVAFLKTLPWHNDTLAIGAGLGLRCPTASDLTVNQSNGQQLYEVKNRAFDLLPYIGTVWTPSPRWFLTQIAQLDFDLNTNPVFVDEDPNHYVSNTGTPVNAGGLKDPPFFFYDASLGYWLVQKPPGSKSFLTGLAAQFEVHYNQSLGTFGSVSAPYLDQAGLPLEVPNVNDGLNGAGNPAVLTPVNLQLGGGQSYQSVDLTAGLTAEVRDNAYFSLGVVVPVTSGIGHEFDYEVRANFSYYFGHSAKQYRVGSLSAPNPLSQ